MELGKRFKSIALLMHEVFRTIDSAQHSLALQRLITSHNSRAVVNLGPTYLGASKYYSADFFP